MANVSKDTLKRELKRISGIPKEEFKLQNINLFFGDVNATEYCTTMYNFPPVSELVDMVTKNTTAHEL